MKQSNTKERILDEACRLFGRFGYGATGVDRIAEAVGIKAPSLYKHFGGKEEILLGVMARVEARQSERLALLFSDAEESAADEWADEARWRTAAYDAVRDALRDPIQRDERRFLGSVAFCDERVAALRQRQREAALSRCAAWLEHLSEQGILRRSDSRLMAWALLSPMWVLLARADDDDAYARETPMLAEELAAQFRQSYRVQTDAARDGRTPLGRRLPVSLM